MGKVVNSSEVLKIKPIMKWFRGIYRQCNVWVNIFLKQALNGFHSLSTSLLLQKIVWAACYVGDTIFGCHCVLCHLILMNTSLTLHSYLQEEGQEEGKICQHCTYKDDLVDKICYF